MPVKNKPPVIWVRGAGREIPVPALACRDDLWGLGATGTVTVDWRQPVVGWRYAQVGSWRGKLAVSPLLPPIGRSPAAECTASQGHPAGAPSPDPCCSCGYRIVRDLGTLAAYHRRVLAAERAIGYQDAPPKVFVRVAGAGLCADREPDVMAPGGGSAELDPRLCVRVQRVEILGPVFVPRELAHLAGALVASYPRLRKKVHVADDLLALTGGAPAPAAAS